MGVGVESSICKHSTKKNLHILVEEKMEGRDTVVKSVFAKDNKSKAEKNFVVYHLPKSQTKYLTEFNDCRTQKTAALSMYV